MRLVATILDLEDRTTGFRKKTVATRIDNDQLESDHKEAKRRIRAKFEKNQNYIRTIQEGAEVSVKQLDLSPLTHRNAQLPLKIRKGTTN